MPFSNHLISTDVLGAMTNVLVDFSDRRYSSLERVFKRYEIHPEFDETKTYSYGDFISRGTTVAANLITLTRSSKDRDYVDSNLLSVSSVYQGNTTYVVTTDYTVQGCSVKWVAGHGPAVDTQYTVVYRFNSPMTYVCNSATPITGEWVQSNWRPISYPELIKEIYVKATRAYYPDYVELVTTSFEDEIIKIESTNDIETKLSAIRNALVRIYQLAPSLSDFLGVENYSPTRQYTTGDIFTFNEALYRALTDIPYGSDRPYIYCEQIVIGESIVDADNTKKLLDSMVPKLTDKDRRIVLGYLYNYNGVMRKALQTYTKMDQESWADHLDKLQQVSLAEITLLDSTAITKLTASEYEELPPARKNVGEYVITDQSLLGTNVRFYNSYSEYSADSSRTNNVISFVKGSESKVYLLDNILTYSDMCTSDDVAFISCSSLDELTTQEWVESTIQSYLNENVAGLQELIEQYPVLARYYVEGITPEVIPYRLAGTARVYNGSNGTTLDLGVVPSELIIFASYTIYQRGTYATGITIMNRTFSESIGESPTTVHNNGSAYDLLSTSSPVYLSGTSLVFKGFYDPSTTPVYYYDYTVYVK